MEEAEIDWSSIQEKYDHEITSKICQFTANEFSSYKSDFPNLTNLKESVEKQWEAFIGQFTTYTPIFEPSFYSDKILNDYKREISPKIFSNLVGVFQKLIERTKWKNNKVFQRLNSEYIYPKHTNEFELYMKSSSSFLEECSNAICSLQSPEIDPKYVELALRYDLFKSNVNFAITNLYQIFKHFPLIRRREILTIASNRFIADLENEMTENLLPKLIKDPDTLKNELRRLSECLNIKFDIDSHDGQFFSYLCEKLYGKLSTITFTIENTTDEIPLVSDPTLLDRLNHGFVQYIQIDPGIKASFDVLTSTSNRQMNELMSKFSFQAQKILSNDRVTCLLRLQYCRNKTLFQSIVKSLQTLSELREEIHKLNEEEEPKKEKPKESQTENQDTKQQKEKTETKMPIRSPDQIGQTQNPEVESKALSEEELQKLNQKKGGRSNKNLIKKNKKKEPEAKKELTFFEMQYSIFKKEILAAASLIKTGSTSVLDNESLLEMLLDLFDQYYKQKLSVVHSLIEINRNLPPLYLIEDNVPSNFRFNVKATAYRFMEMRPTFLPGAHSSCLTPIRLSLGILEKMSTCLRTLINFQIFSHNYFMNSNKDLFPFFEFPELEETYQTSSEEFPYSFGHFYFCLSRIPDFVACSFRIASEICTSFSAKALKCESYFLYATWEQLLQEMNHLFAYFQPESYHFNMNMSDMVSKIMTSRYLNDLHFIHEEIEKQEEDKKLQYALKIRQMVNLTNMLRNFLIQTDTLLPVFKRQANQIAKTDIKDAIDLAYGEYDFNSMSDQWEPDELLKIIKSQKNFYLSLLIAVRYNNCADDSLFIKEFFEMENHGSGFDSRPTHSMLQHQQILRNVPNMIFYEPKLFVTENVTSIFCDISQISKDAISNTEYIIEQYMPYCLKSEIAFLSGYERCFLKHYSSTDVFILDATPEVNSILSKDNKINLFYVPTHFQCLTINSTSLNDLHQILRFLSIRVQMNEWIRHDSHITSTRAKTLENIYTENLLFTSPFFSRLNVEINRDPQAGEIDFSVKFFEIERVTYVCKQILTALNIYESVIAPENKSTTFITTTSPPVITYTVESAVSYLNDLISAPKGRPTFLTPSLYIQKCMNQFWYQCNDQFRQDFLAASSSVEQKIDDSIIGFEDSKHQLNAYSYALDWLRLSLLKLGYYYLNETHDPRTVSFRSALNGLNKKSFAKGKNLFEENVNIKSTARIGARPEIGTIETALMRERTTTIVDVLKTQFFTEMKRIIEEQFENTINLIDEAFSAPNHMLKPDCYAKVMRINSILTNYLPTISSIKEQFSSELGYAHSRFCHALYRAITINAKVSSNENDNKMLSFTLESVNDEFIDISKLLNSFVSEAKTQLFKTWSGYLLNVLREYGSHSEMQTFLNMYVSLFKENYNNTINFKLATKLSALLNTLSHLRDKEKFMNREQIKFEKRVTDEIKAEFDLLLSDLGDEIKKAQYKFVEKKEKIYGQAFAAINRFKDNPEFINNTTEKDNSYAVQLLSAPIEIRDPDRRTLIKVQVQQRKQAREQRRKLRKLHKETRINQIREENPDDENAINEVEYSSSESNSDDDEFDEDGRKRRKEKDVQKEMDKIRDEIDSLQIERKKLRVRNALSTIGFIKIYTRMIEKVAEEKKGYSALLLQNHRLFEEEMVKIDEELHGAYNALTNVEINIETLKNDIEESKKKNVKLIHWREMCLRKSGDIQKELKILTTENTNSGNVNVTNLLKKISEKQDELEMLNYENEKLDEEIYFEVREPMMQLDYMRREITRRRAQQAQMIQQQQYEMQQQQEQYELENSQQQEQEFLEQNESSKVHFTLPKSPRNTQSGSVSSHHSQSQNELEEEQQIEQEEEQEHEVNHQLEEEEEVGDFNDENEMTISQLASSRTVSQRGFSKMQELLKENEILKDENESIRKQIQELEAQLKATPKTALPLLTDLFTVKQTPAPASARPRSTKHKKKTIVRPGVGRAFVGNSRPQTSRL